MSLQVTDASDDTLTQQVKGTDGAAHVLDVAIHPGEDSTFDRTWGGSRAAGKAALTGSGAVGAAGARMYYGFIVTTALSAAAITIYDNTTATGTVLWSSGTIVVATGQNPGIVAVPFPDGLAFYTGLSMGVTIAACNLLASFE